MQEITTLGELLREPAAAHPDRDAIVIGAERFSYAETDRRANRVARPAIGHGTAGNRDARRHRAPTLQQRHHWPRQGRAVMRAGPAAEEPCRDPGRRGVLKRGATATAEELVVFARTRIGGFKVPRSIDFLTELPRNATGKFLKRMLREPYWQGRDRRVN
jgi:acyl-CoA synthetase (AMP-forming)/AMP-acid ligase II